MPLNKQTGNMYPFVTHTWNIIRGKCPHECTYCYMQRFWEMQHSTKQTFVEKELKTNLGEGNYIFVGSSTDMFAESVPSEWIDKVIEHCRKYPNNTYIFQSKNPQRFHVWLNSFPPKTILGTTIETNCFVDKVSCVPDPVDRAFEMSKLRCDKMVSIEPIMNFDLEALVYFIEMIKPKFVSIGADSQGHNLPEPSTEKLNALITELRKFTDVRIKSNLKRLGVEE